MHKNKINMGKSARVRITEFTRSSSRWSGRRLIRPKDDVQPPVVLELVDQSGARKPKKAANTLTGVLLERTYKQLA